MIYYVILILFLIVNCSAKDFEKFAEDTLEQKYGKIVHASVLFRHGERTPYASYPFDPFKNYDWPEGYGHLTNDGKMRLYNLGKWYRTRYNALVGEKYSSEELLMHSSDFDRSLMSAECFLAGFFPPDETDLWNDENLKWQPIPVHAIPLAHDNMIAMYESCDVYNHELFTANVAKKFKQMYKQNEKFFNYVGINSGILFSDHFIVYSLWKLMEVYDALNVQNQNGLPLPEWAESVFPEPMASLAINIFHIGTHTNKMKRIKAGPFLKSLRDDINNKVEGNLVQNLHFYSGHDTTISTVMIALNVFNNILPPYGSSLIFELRRKESEYYITLLYRNSTETPPVFIELPNCEQFCTLDNFINIIQPITTENWVKECEVIRTFPEKIVDSWPFNQMQTLLLFFVITFLILNIRYHSHQRRIQKLKDLSSANNKIKKIQ